MHMCIGGYGTDGCNGAWPIEAFQYLETTKLETEQNYPYKAMVSYSCTY